MNTTRTPTANRFISPDSYRRPAPRGWESCSYLMRWLRDTYLASHTLKVGDTAPGFLLSDAEGRLHSSEQLRRNGPSS
jgi:hypothetical protein